MRLEEDFGKDDDTKLHRLGCKLGCKLGRFVVDVVLHVLGGIFYLVWITVVSTVIGLFLFSPLLLTRC